MSLCVSLPILAAETGNAYCGKISEGELTVFVSDPGGTEEVLCQVGTVPCEEVHAVSQEEDGFPVETVLLVDNSLSVEETYRPAIAQLLQDMVGARLEEECFTLATFDEELHYLVTESSDYTELKNAIESITYQDQETNVTDVLYECLSDLREKEGDSLRRILLISDGMDSETVGYSQQELFDLISEYTCPIYTLGCTYRDNSEELESMFRLSRQTGSAWFLLDEVENTDEVLKAIRETDAMLRVTATLPEEVCDGTSKGVLITVSGSGGSHEASTSIKMPFAEAAAAEETESASQETQETVQESEEAENVPRPAASPGGTMAFVGKWWPLFAGCVAVAVILVILIIIFTIRGRKNQAPEKKEPEKEEKEPKEEKKHEEPEKEDVGGAKTYMLWRGTNDHMLKLSDQDRPSRILELPLKDKVVIGRSKGQAVFDYEKSVSGTHCEISARNGHFYVKDLHSSNGTTVNGKALPSGGEAEIYSGAILNLGRLRLKVEIK